VLLHLLTNESELNGDLMNRIQEEQTVLLSKLNGLKPYSRTFLIGLDMERAIRQPVIQGEDRTILNWISEYNYWIDQQKFFGLAEPLTGQQFLDSVELQSWIEGEKRFLWCPGDRKSHPLSD
jgi:hypothetical protein